MSIERFSLLRKLASSSSIAPLKYLGPLRSSLYSLLDSTAESDRFNLFFRAVDSNVHRDYILHRYERYKAGLLGRVWLKKLQHGDSSSDKAILITDQEALGLKWRAIPQENK